MATDGGVVRFDPSENTFASYTKLDGLAGNRVLSIAADNQGTLWFGTDSDGLSKLTGDNEFAFPRHFVGRRINSLYLENDSTLYVATDEGISLFRPDRDEIKETYHQFGGLPRNNEVFSVVVLDEHLWAGADRGVAYAPLFQASGVHSNLQDPTSWTSFLLGQRVYNIIQADSAVFLGTTRGSYVQEGDAWRHLKLTFSFYDLEIFQEKLIAATRHLPVYQTPLRNPPSWTKNVSLPSGTCCLDVSPDSSLWAGVEGGLLMRLKSMGEDSLKVDTFSVNTPAANTFMDLAIDQQGRIWAASSYRDQTGSRGAYRFDGDQWTNYFAAPNAQGEFDAKNCVVCIAVDARSRVWLGTWGAGIHLLSELGWELVNQNNSVLRGIPNYPPYVVINDITEDSEGNIWISNFLRGVAVFDDFPPQEQVLYTPLDGLPTGEDGHFQGNVIAVDETDLKWIGTLNAGFCLFDDGGTPYERGDDNLIRFSSSTHPEYMTSNKITDITLDKEGVLWVGTDSGVYAIRGQYNQITRSYTEESWDTHLRDLTVNRILVDSQNNKWFAIEGGSTEDGPNPRALSRLSADGNSWTHYTRETSGLVDNSVKSLALDDLNNALWIGTLLGLNRFEVPRASPRQTVLAYPNPFVSGAGKELVTFPDLTPNSAVRIFTLTGEPVNTLRVEQSGKATWDGTNSSGNLVASGIYFYSLRNQNGTSMRGKLVVLRKE